MDVRLVIFKSDGRTKEIPIKPGRYLVGRREGATLRIPLPSVSREHCEIVHENGRLHVRDLGSSNGTFRNSERVTEADLAAGDTLAIGQVQMTVRIDGKPERPTPTPATPGSADSSMMETPPAGLKPQPAKPAAPAPPPAKAPARDPDQTTPKSDSSSDAVAPGDGHDESSIFEFDFDFEDDDRPRL